MADLNDKQRRFAQEYVVDFNGTQAAIRARYSPNGANVTGTRLLANPNVAAYIEGLKAELAERTMVNAEKVRIELARHAFTNMRDFVEWGPNGVTLKPSDELLEDDAAAVTEVSESFGENGRTLKFKLGHKDSALKVLAQHTGLISKEGGGVNVTVNVEDARRREEERKQKYDRLHEELNAYRVGYDDGNKGSTGVVRLDSGSSDDSPTPLS